MQSFFRFILVLLLIVSAFVGGWFSSTFIQQDPFLSNIFPLNHDMYSRFLRDLSSLLEERRIQDQSELVDTLLDLQDERTATIVQQVLDKAIDPLSLDMESHNDATEPSDIAFAPIKSTTDKGQSLYVFDPTEFVSTIMKRMTAREKLSFLVWARSRFTSEQLQQMESLLSMGMTPENMLKLYQFARPNLTGKDIEYLLTLVDKYFEWMDPAKQPSIPTYQANEATVDHYISGN